MVDAAAALWSAVSTAGVTLIDKGQLNEDVNGSDVQANALSQFIAPSDVTPSATNYPLVRITMTATGHVFYCRTAGHSSMAVASPATVSTHFEVPSTIETGTGDLVVVANGIASAPVAVTVN